MLAAEAGFPGFRPAAFAFLCDLAAHNDKPWFAAHRGTYERELKTPLALLVTAVSTELACRGLPLAGDARRSAFRIHRDVRFARDKRPYKTNGGALWFHQGGARPGNGVLYFHLADAGCFAAAAFWMPDPDTLDAIRESIRVRPAAFTAMQDALTATGLALATDDTLTRMPRGFEDLRDSSIASALRLRSFAVSRPLPRELAQSPALVAAVASLAADALPLLRFGWSAIDEVA